MAATHDKQKDLWNKMWTDDKALMTAADQVPLLLKKFIDSAENGRKALKFFVPMCGNAFELKWLADRGHTVVGVEFIPEALVDFYKTHSIEYTTEPSAACGGTLYKSNDGKIRLYCCDLLDFNSDVEGLFDAVYDTHSVSVLAMAKRQRCANALVSLMAPGCRYLLDTYDEVEGGHHHGDDHHGDDHHHGHQHGGDHHHGDDHHHGHDDDGPSCSFTEADVNKFYGDKCDVTKLFDMDAHEVWKTFSETAELPNFMQEMPPSQQKLYLLTLKQ